MFFLDEISTGLDSSATYDIVSAIRTFARVRQSTCLLSLLQPSPEVFELIDRLDSIMSTLEMSGMLIVISSFLYPGSWHVSGS